MGDAAALMAGEGVHRLPVIDVEGRVVGVSLAILGGSSLGVVLPSSLAVPVLRDLERKRQSDHGFAGIALADDPDHAATPGAVRVSSVVPGGPAEQAHLRAGDRILALDGHPLQGAPDLRRRLFTTPPGSLVRLDVARAAEHLTVSVRLQPLPPSEQW